MLAMQSSRDMLEKLRREIDRLAGSIIRQEIVDHGLNAAMTAWHLTDWAWREIQGSTRLPTLIAGAGAPISDLKQFRELVKHELRRVGLLRRHGHLHQTFRLLEAPGVLDRGDRAI